MEQAVENSKVYFNSGYGCAESVLKAVTEFREIKSELIPRIATGFCGGMAYTNGMCGAVTGAVLSLNLVYGRDRADQSKTENYEAIQILLERFREKFGDITCPGLIGIDLGSEEGHRQFDQSNKHLVCADFVSEATRMVIEIMENSK